jgi:hypothetical protein
MHRIVVGSGGQGTNGQSECQEDANGAQGF